MPAPSYNSSRIIAAGFILVLALIALILLAGTLRLQESREQLRAVVEHHNVKVDLLFSMRNLVRERSLSMYAIYFSRDPFERNDEYLRFTGMVDEFVELRSRLEGMGLDPTEQQLLNDAYALIRRSQPLQVSLVNRLLAGDLRGVEAAILTDDLPLEKQILAKFGRLVEYERARAQEVETVAMASSDQTLRLLQILVPATLLIGLAIAGYVLRQTRRTENALYEEKDQAEITLHSIADGVITTDANGQVRTLNPVAEQLTGWTSAEAGGQPLARIYKVLDEARHDPVQHPAYQGGLDGPCCGLEHNILLVSRQNHEHSVEDSVAPIRDRSGHVTGQVLIFRDVTMVRNMTRNLSWQANHDPLTGLPNRRAFETTLQHLLDTVRHDARQHGLLYIDLDQFKLVNDTSGHAAGDELLRQLATVLQSRIRHSDLLARLGGDEFGVLLEGCSPEQARRIANQLRETLETFRFLFDNRVFAISGSIGLVDIRTDSPDLAGVLASADRACYTAKKHGGNCVRADSPDEAGRPPRYGES